MANNLTNRWALTQRIIFIFFSLTFGCAAFCSDREAKMASVCPPTNNFVSRPMTEDEANIAQRMAKDDLSIYISDEGGETLIGDKLGSSDTLLAKTGAIPELDEILSWRKRADFIQFVNYQDSALRAELKPNPKSRSKASWLAIYCPLYAPDVLTNPQSLFRKQIKDFKEKIPSKMEELHAYPLNATTFHGKKAIYGLNKSINTGYFDVKLMSCATVDSVDTGNQFDALPKEEGAKYLILTVSIKNVDTETRILFAGDAILRLNGKEYVYDVAEPLASKGWNVSLEHVNPLTTITSNIVYKITKDFKGFIYWAPGRSNDSALFSCGIMD